MEARRRGASARGVVRESAEAMMFDCGISMKQRVSIIMFNAVRDFRYTMT